MSAPGHTTGLTANTFSKIQLNAGIFVLNADYSSIVNATTLATAIANLKAGTTSALGTGAKLLGATRGGGSFQVTRDTREVDADGKRYGFKGDTFVDAVDAQLSTTMIEITLENIKNALPGAAITGSSPKRTLKLATAIATTDYLTNICWIGDTASGQLILVCLKNALNQSDFNLTFQDKGEGTVAVEFHAKQATVDDYDYAPFEVVEFTPAT